MRQSLFALALCLVLPAVAGVCFHRLIAAPDALIVDGDRASVDHADRGHSRGLGNDLTSVFLPRFRYIVGQIRENGLRPAWDATGFGGRPLVGNPQAGLNYPPVWLAWRNGRSSALGWLTVAHLLGGGIGVYCLGRLMGLGRVAAIVAGGCFQASPILIGHTFEGHYPHVWSACWYPWAFWALMLARQRKVLGYWVLPGVLALTFLTGHPQEWYLLVLALGVWVVAESTLKFRAGKPRESVADLCLWLGLLVVSLGLCAVEIVPEIAVRPWVLKASRFDLGHINRYQLHALNLLQVLSPYALGKPDDYAGHDNYWETVCSVGLVPLILAVVGVTSYRDRAFVRRWGWLVVVALVFAGGRKLGLYALAYAVLPGMERFRVPSRSLFLVALGASILAGAGVQTLNDRRLTARGWRTLRRGVWAGMIAAGVSAFLIGVISDRNAERLARKPLPFLGNGLSAQYQKYQDAKVGYRLAGEGVFWVAVVGSLVVVTIGGGGRRGQVVAAWGLASLALVELSVYAQSILVCAPAERFLGGEAFQVGQRFIVNDASGPIRVASLGNLYPDLAAVIEGVEKTNINDSFQIQHAADLYERLYPLLEPAYLRQGVERAMDAAVDDYRGRNAQGVMDLMSARYLFADHPLPLKTIDRLDFSGEESEGLTLWRNRGALPRAYVVPKAFTGLSDEGATFARRLNERDLRDGVILSVDPLGPGDRQPFTTAEWVSRDPDRVIVRVETRAPGLLVVGNTWMPGWSATVDASTAPVLRGNHCQQVIPLATPGPQEIILRYDPPGLEIGRAITAVMGLVWGAFGAVELARSVRVPVWTSLAIRVRPSRSACG